ncbi:MAG: type IV secretion system protein [Rhodobacteraceae bacterium]|nr:type IV secretion system protein [Paracoccaceae bacterium]
MGSDDYALARAEWDDRFAGQRRALRFMAALTILSVAGGLAGAGYGMWATINARYVPYIVAVDDIGKAALAPSPTVVTDWPVPVVKRELETWLERLRTVTPDIAVLRSNHAAAAAYMEVGTPAFTKLETAFNQPGMNPLERAKTMTVSADVRSINAVGGSSWRLEWVETSFNRTDGKQISRKRFVATVLVEFRVINDLERLETNPLGLFIRDIDIQEERA